MKKKTVVITIGQKNRELLAATLIAMELAKRGMKVFILPFYKMTDFIDLIHPDYILLHNLHKENDHIFERWTELGCGIGVLPSEGGALMGYSSGSSQMIHLSRSAKVYSQLSHYFAWGDLEASIVGNILPSGCAVITGQPRIDLLQPSFSSLFDSSLPSQFSYPYILVATNFPSINIRGSIGLKDQLAIDKLVREQIEIYIDHDEIYWQKYNAERLIQYQLMIELVRELAKKHPDLRFILRSHPFERVETYFEELGDLSNVTVTNEGGIELWLKNARCIIQVNSTSGVDATLAGIRAISPGWIPSQITMGFATEAQKILSAINLHPKDINELSDIISSLYNNEPQQESSELERIWKEHLQPYYFSRDAMSFIRIADSIEYDVKQRNLLPSRKEQLLEKYGIFQDKTLQNQIRFAFKLPYDLTARGIKNNYLTRKRPVGEKLYKKFTLSEITTNVEILRKHPNFIDCSFEIKAVTNQDLSIPTIRKKQSIYKIEML